MGTRGAVGFVVDDQVIASYNHFDSYPSYLGRVFLQDAREILKRFTFDPDALVEAVEGLRKVHDGDPISKADLDEFGAYFENLNYPGIDWYELLRGMQGRLLLMFDEGIMLVCGDSWMHDGLFNEFSYLLNLDTKQIEFYKGFCRRDCKGRFCDRSTSSNGDRVTLVGVVDFVDFLDQDDEALLREIYGEDYY